MIYGAQPQPWPVANQAVPTKPQPQSPAWQARPPATARGVSAEPAPTRFVLSSPDVLGVKAQAPAVHVDWTAIQARLDRLRVVSYKKKPAASGVCVTLHLPTANPGLVQPVEAQADTEAAAALLALQAAEPWMQNRR